MCVVASAKDSDSDSDTGQARHFVNCLIENKEDTTPENGSWKGTTGGGQDILLCYLYMRTAYSITTSNGKQVSGVPLFAGQNVMKTAIVIY